eukprot:SAG11_NODE_28086_length_325_cov_1.982301_1_plen_68_part_01
MRRGTGTQKLVRIPQNYSLKPYLEDGLSYGNANVPRPDDGRSMSSLGGNPLGNDTAMQAAMQASSIHA